MKASLRRLALVATFLVTTVVVPRRIAGWDARAYFEGDLGAQDALAKTVADAAIAQKRHTAYGTGLTRFDGQSEIAIDQMALLGLGQILLQHPEKREEYLPAMRAAAERIASRKTLRYAAEVYGGAGIDRLATDEGHAYLGYVNLGLGMLRLVDRDMSLAGLHDRITEALVRRLDRDPHGLIETYPGETWPPDVSAVAGSIGLHAKATGVDRSAMLERWAKRFEACALHPATGFLVQRVETGTCRITDPPRGSGTAIAAYFLSFATPELSRRLEGALVTTGWVDVLGFGGVREYPPGFSGQGDINAGPILFGISVGATGFALGATRTHGDRDHFIELYRSTSLFGVPTSTGYGHTAFVTGGVLGNALLLAMLTARAP